MVDTTTRKNTRVFFLENRQERHSTQYSADRNAKISSLEKHGASCRKCHYFYHVTSPAGDLLYKQDKNHNITHCRLKDKHVKSYNICGHFKPIDIPAMIKEGESV